MVDIIQGDFGSDLNFTITDANDAALDLTNSTVTFKMKKLGETTNKVSAGCDIVVEADGTCKYTLAEGDTDTTGTYEWEVQAVFATKVVTAKGTNNIEIKEELPA